jgi:hypothetical protein
VGAGAGCGEPNHPAGNWPASLSPLGIPDPSRLARRQDGRPQLRSRRWRCDVSWGTAHIALEAVGDTKARCAVLGCGAVGWRRHGWQRRGALVTIYARDLPPRTTSNVAGAQWSPVSVADAGRRTPAFDEQFSRAARLSYRYFQDLLGAGYGVRWIENYFLGDEPPRRSWEQELIADLYPATSELGPGQHPFPTRYARRVLTMFIEPQVYLNALQRDFLLQGGRIVVREFSAVDEIRELSESVVMNCTGPGRARLRRPGASAGEGPADGPASAAGSGLRRDRPRGLYVPALDGILLGGTFERGVDSLGARIRQQAERILNGHARLFGAMR